MFRRRIILLPALLVVAGCDQIPTEPPMWEQTWVVPGEEVEVSVAELLPPGVSLSEDSTAFLTTIGGISTSRTLAEMCPECAAFGGTVSAKPAFTDTIRAVTTLPDQLLSALVSGGGLDVTLDHNLSFDPLRPGGNPGDERGFLVVNVISEGTVFAHDSISGDDVAFDTSAAPLQPSLDFDAAQVAQQIDIEIIIYSPEGDPVQIRPADTLSVVIASSPVEIAEATIEATGFDIADGPTTLDFESLDAGLIDRVRSGALRLTVDNQLAVTGGVDLAFAYGDATVTKPVPIDEGEYRTRFDFADGEIRSMLQAGEVDVSTDGSVSATGSTLTVTPTQTLLLNADFELVLLVGGSEGAN